MVIQRGSAGALGSGPLMTICNQLLLLWFIYIFFFRFDSHNAGLVIFQLLLNDAVSA